MIDRQTDNQIDSETHRHIDGPTDRQTTRLADRQTNKQIDVTIKYNVIPIKRQIEIQTSRGADKLTDR